MEGSQNPTLPVDVLVEIFSHSLGQYSTFRRLCKETRDAKTSWDGWDSLIEQGYSVEIFYEQIIWFKDGLVYRIDGPSPIPFQIRRGIDKNWGLGTLAGFFIGSLLAYLIRKLM